MSSNNTQSSPRKARSVWPFLIVGLLCAHAGGMIFVVTVTRRHKPAVIENYYEKAVNWDRDRGHVAN